MQPRPEDAATNCGLLVASNRLPRSKPYTHLSLANIRVLHPRPRSNTPSTSFRQHQRRIWQASQTAYPKEDHSRHSTLLRQTPLFPCYSLLGFFFSIYSPFLFIFTFIFLLSYCFCSSLFFPYFFTHSFFLFIFSLYSFFFLYLSFLFYFIIFPFPLLLFFCCCVFWCFILFCQHLCSSLHTVVGVEPHGLPAWGLFPPKNTPKSVKTQL